MGHAEHQKLRLLYLKKILEEKTDENHGLTMQELVRALAHYDITAERKSIMRDIETLRDFGLDILSEKRGSKCYYAIGRREFQLAELKLLADAVASAHFLTERKAQTLLKKIAGLTSQYEGKTLARQIFVQGRPKTENEQIYYNVDTLHQAIAQKKQITFHYFHYGFAKEKVYRNQGKPYQVSPFALVWDHENYYLIGHCPKHQTNCSHFRDDKMEQIQMTSMPAIPWPNTISLPDYLNQQFAMFPGQQQWVKLLFTNDLLHIVYDRFGKDIFIQPVDDKHFSVTLPVAVSNNFFGWLLQFGQRVDILGPAEIIAKWQTLLQNVLQHSQNRKENPSC